MPFKSHAERTRLRKLVDEGAFPRQDFDDLERATNLDDLPDRLTPARPAPAPPRLSTGGSTRYTRALKSTLY